MHSDKHSIDKVAQLRAEIAEAEGKTVEEVENRDDSAGARHGRRALDLRAVEDAWSAADEHQNRAHRRPLVKDNLKRRHFGVRVGIKKYFKNIF